MSHPRAWMLLIVLIALHMLGFLDRFIILLMVGPIKAEFGVSDVQIGLLHGAAFGLVYAVFALPLGWLADRIDRRKVIFGGVLIWSLATVASAFAHSYEQLFAARLLVGIGEAALVPAAYSMLSDAFPKSRLAFAAAIFAAAVPVGAAAAIAVGGVLLDAVAGHSLILPLLGTISDWHLAFLILGVPGMVLAFAIFVVPEPRRLEASSEEAAQTEAGIAAFAWSRRSFFLPLFFAAGFASMLGNGVFGWLPTYVMREFHWPVAEVGLTIGIVAAISGVFGGALGGYVVDRWFAAGRLDAHVRYYAIAMALLGIWTVAAFSVPSAALCFFFFALVQLCAQFYGVAGAAIQLVTPREYRGRMSALYLFVYNIMGVGLGPVLVAGFTGYVLRDEARLGLALTLTALLCAPMASFLFAKAGRGMRHYLRQGVVCNK